MQRESEARTSRELYSTREGVVDYMVERGVITRSSHDRPSSDCVASHRLAVPGVIGRDLHRSR